MSNGAPGGEFGNGRWFGYDATMPADASPLDLPEQGLVCMAWAVDYDDLKALQADGYDAFGVGVWAVSTGAHNTTVVHGPFADMAAAFAFARTQCGAVRFLQAPTPFLAEDSLS